MGLEEDLARKLGLPVRVIGSGCLISAADAEAFLAGCRREGLRVMAIEGFRVEGTTRVPDMNAIANFSAPTRPYSVSDSIRDSRRFLEEVRSRDLMFEFDLEPGDYRPP